MRSGILKFLAVISFGLVTFPFVLTNDVLSFENISVLRMLAYYAGFGVVFGAGYAFGRVTVKRKKLIPLERLVGMLSFCAALLLLTITDELGIIFAAGVSCVLWYFLGERAAHKHYADIFPAFMFGVYIVVTLVCYLFYGAMCDKELKEPVQTAVIIAFMTEMCLAALLINQSGIYDKANRRRETRTMLPKGLSGYNAALVTGITVGGLLLYVFSDKIVWLLNETVRLMIKLFVFIMKGNVDFMAIETGDNGADYTGNMEYRSYDILNLLFFALIIALVVIFRRQLWQVIKDFFSRIAGFFTRETQLSEAEPEFVDVFEQVSDVRKMKDLSYQTLMKRYKKEADPVKKYRLGYAVLLWQMKYCRAKLSAADTVTDQYEKGREIFGAELQAITSAYDKLRYDGETVTAEQLSALDSLIGNAASLVKSRV